jgi:succinate dehydrogenase / fumarate reductase, cytochrome b subunit
MYKGREGQWAFILHRLSGIAIALYLFIHVLNVGAVMFGEQTSKALLAFFHVAPFRVGLIFVMAGVVYHALNGLRIIIMDFTGWGVKYQRQLWYGTLALTTMTSKSHLQHEQRTCLVGVHARFGSRPYLLDVRTPLYQQYRRQRRAY